MDKFAKKDANDILSRLDKMASHIQANAQAWGMPFETAKSIVNDLDAVADAVEVTAFGKQSFESRQAEVLQKDSDEPYMSTFNAPMKPHQKDADEAYMSAYNDDQTSAVRDGKSSTGRPLAK